MIFRMQMRYSRRGKLWAKALIVGGMGVWAIWGCTEAGRPTKNKDAPLQATEYAKFLEYMVGDAKVFTVPANPDGGDAANISYLVGEEFLPSRLPGPLQQDYNFLQVGNGMNIDGTLNPDQSFFYRDYSLQQRGASDHPEAVVVDDQLKLYFTNQPFTIPVSTGLPGGESFNSDQIPGANPPTVPYVYMDLNSYMTLGFQHGFATYDPNPKYGNTTDVDVLAFIVPQPNTMVHFRTAAHQYYAGRYILVQLTLLDQDGITVLAQSHAGFDLWTFQDAEIGYFFARPGTYFLMLEDLNQIQDPGKFPPSIGNSDYLKTTEIYLFSESITTSFADEAFIRRGDLQPARNGNPELNGGRTFEPDDTKTILQDVFPDCDGIPGTGDEGDWGVNEKCWDFEGGNGVQDGQMQYWEIDDKENLDDGEYFTAKDTNVRSFGQEAPSLIVAPGGSQLWMWINAGDAIYQLESLDGLEGLNWDLSNLFQHRPAIRAGDNGDPDSPVVASGVYGYCETRADNSDVQVVDLCTVKGKPVGCKGYPRTSAVTFGEDDVLDTPAQSDVLDPGRNLITSGPDGIINTFFLPNHLHYGPPFYQGLAEQTVPTDGGPANPDVLCADSVPGANDDNAYLLGDDVWAPGLTVTPAEFWRNHNCVFFQLGDDFSRCAMGIPDTVAVRTGTDGRLNTVEQILKDLGDDQLCHAGPMVGICPGPDGIFGWEDLYLPLQGDDELCIQTDPVLMTKEVAICPGRDGVLETTVIDTFINVTEISTIGVPGGSLPPAQNGDVCCDPLEVAPACTAICPGADYQLQSLYPLYFSDISSYKNPSPPINGDPVVFGKTDNFTDFDDEMCVIGDSIAICPGPNGYFQSYPLSRRFAEKEYEDYEDLLKNYTGPPNDCYTLEVQKKQDSFGEVTEKIFTLYRNEGVLFDDEIRWDSGNQEYYISTGANGINQTCSAAVDQLLIPHLRGLANQPIILPGPNGVLDTPALADELEVIPIENSFPIKKINTGPDGISNSFALGDDRVEIYLGTGKSDWPCVKAGPDRIADTQAQGNDAQLFRPGEVTGFDAYQVGYPDIVREDDQLYLFYTGLGWAQVPDSWRKDRGALAILGECDRAGLDNLWGSDEVIHEATWASNPPFITSLTIDERTLVKVDGATHYSFLHTLDNDQGVLLAPRIGVATSTIQRIQADPTDWDKRPKPVIDIAKFCSKALDMPIDLGLDISASVNPPHYNGAFSSDTYIYHEQSSGQPIFVMAFSGLSSGTETKDNVDKQWTDEPLNERFSYNASLARSLDARNWDVAYDLGTLIINPSAALDVALAMADPDNYRNPTLAKGQGDSYNLFFNRFKTRLGNSGVMGLQPQFGSDDSQSWIGLGVRRGAVTVGACFDVAGSASLQEQNHRQTALSVIVIAIPLLIGIGWRLFRKDIFSA